VASLKRRFLGLALAGLTLWPLPAPGQPGPAAIVLGADREFPPYEYEDEQGQPAGFNIQLMRALGRTAGVDVRIELGDRSERMSAFDQGRTDIMFLSYSEQRAAKYVLLDQTWTLAQVALMRPGLDRYPSSAGDFAGFRIAVDEGSTNHLYFEGLTPSSRPTLVLHPDRASAVDAFRRGTVDGVAGNQLTLRYLLGGVPAGAHEVQVISRAYHLAVLPGHEARVASLRAALATVRASGEFDRLVEQYLASRAPASWVERNLRWIQGAFVVAALLLVTGLVWNQSLQRQVATRTATIERREQEVRELVDNANDMIYRCGLDGRFVFVNPVATRTLRYSEAELLSMRYDELVRPDHAARVVNFYQDAARTSSATYLEFPVRRKDGSELWVGQQVSPILKEGKLTGFQGVARDVTDRVVAEGALKAERDFAAAVLDTAPTLVMVLDADGRIVRFNRACEALTGVNWEALAGGFIWDMPFLLDEDRLQVQQAIPRLASASAPSTLERVWVDTDGGRHLIAWTVSPLKDDAGRTEALIGVGADVTTVRELERLKSQFVSMVSHELRTPLTSIRASMQLLVADNSAIDAESTNLVHVALTNAERLIRIVNDILDVSKIEAGEMQMVPVYCDLQAIVQESIESVAPLAVDAGVNLESSAQGVGRSLMVHADPHRTIQILVNLLSNAVKHSPEGSTVEVIVSRTPQVARVAVHDHGPGIPPDKLGLIFEPFTQIDGGDTRRIAGTGLGLTIARALATRQGGGIEVSSVEDQGSTFTLRLPIDPQSPL
jgi:PAS domain S-box-containing protein